jgi:hypothetical protein
LPSETTNQSRNHPDECRAIDLAHNVNLCSVHFSKIDLDQHEDFQMSSAQWMVLIISQIKSSQMEVLKISFLPYAIHDLNRVDWDTLAKLFAQPRFSLLKEICFTILPDAGVDPRLGGELIRRKLPACDARGVLSVR